MKLIYQVVTFVGVWVTCCALFIEALNIQGSWLMLAGVVSFWLAGWAAGLVTVNW